MLLKHRTHSSTGRSPSLPAVGGLVAACMGLAVCLTASLDTAAQTVAPVAPATLTAPPSIAWKSLTAAQKDALLPLQSNWEGMGEGQQRKWIALSQNFSTMSASDREKLHARMAEWAALKPKERQQARLNFAETKKCPHRSAPPTGKLTKH